MKDEVAEMKIVSRIMVPGLPGTIIYTSNHLGSRAVGGIGMTSGDTTSGVCRSSHTRDRSILVRSPDPVLVSDVARHDERRWRIWYTTSPITLHPRLYPRQRSLDKTPNPLGVFITPGAWSWFSGTTLLFLYFHWLESTRAFYFYLFLSRTDLCTVSLTHPVTCHVTFLQYIVLSVTCLYLSFLLSSNPTLLDPCVFADKLGYLKSFSLRGTLSW